MAILYENHSRGHPEIQEIRRQSDCFFFHGINILLLQSSNATILMLNIECKRLTTKINIHLKCITSLILFVPLFCVSIRRSSHRKIYDMSLIYQKSAVHWRCSHSGQTPHL